MNFRKTHLAKAIGAVALLGSTQAFAYVPTSNTDADVIITWGGATASSLSAQELTVPAVCDTDVHLLYVTAGGATNPDRPGNDWAIACRTAAAGATRTGLPNNLRVLVVKRDRGGSGVGVGPVQVNTTITFLTLAGNCTATPTPGVNGAPAIPSPDGGNVTLRGCVGTYTVNSLTEMGTSDIEPDKFFGINTPVVDGGGLPYLNVAFAEQYSLGALTFNTPVTLALFQTLQAEQFPASSVCNPTNGSYGAALPASVEYRAGATNGESEACMPSLTRQEVASILAGRLTQWNRLVEADGTTIDAIAGLPSIGTLPVQICRRVDGSGTQATINALVGSFPCDANLVDGSLNIVAPRAGNGTTVIANSGSGDVDNCLHNFNASATNPFAIGNLSVEGRNVARDRNWRYIKIDGVAPTLRNIHGGDYWLFAQQSCQRRSEGLNYNAPASASDTIANKALVFAALCGPAATNGLNSVAALNRLNAGSLYTWGYSGWLATPTTSLAYDNVLDYLPDDPATVPVEAARPVNAVTREVTAGVVNICQTALKSSFGGANAANGIKVAPNPNWTP